MIACRADGHAVPESIVNTGFSEASKKPRCTVVGDALSSWIFSAACAPPAAKTNTALKQMAKVCDLMASFLCLGNV